MFLHTRAVLAKIIEELNRIGYVFLIITQFLYITFLVVSICFGLGISIINFILLIASIIHLSLCVISHKFDFKNEKEIVASEKKVQKHVRLAAQIFKAGCMLYGFFIAAEHNNSFAIVYMVATTLLCVLQILIECLTPIIKTKFDLFVDAVKYDFEGIIKTADFINNLRGEKKLLWGDADKNGDILKEMANDFKKSKMQERKQVRKERRAKAKANFLAKFKKEPSA